MLLWLIVFTSILTSTSPVKVLNVNWKCNDGAPCVNVVRPRGAFAVVNADQDSFKLAISVHRPELARERMLKKWSSAHGTIWNVEVTWFRLVEKGVRISMQHCKYKLVCVVPLLDDEAMARSDETFFDTGLVSHHFLVTVKYEGHKAISEQEIIIEREASANYEEFKSPTVYHEPAQLNQPQRPPIPPIIPSETLDKPAKNSNSPSIIAHSDLQKFLDNKKQKASATLLNSGQYSDSDAGDMIPSLYPVEDAPEDLPSLRSRLDQSDGKILDTELNQNALIDENDGTVVILSQNKTAGVTEKVKGFITDAFIRLGPTATVIILLIVAIVMACLCTCGANRIMKRYHSKGTRDYVKMKENEQSTSSGKTKQKKKLRFNSEVKHKATSPRDTSWFWSKYKRRKEKNGAPSVSAGIQETFATYTKAIGKFLRGARATDEAEYQPLVSDDDESHDLGFGEKMKMTGNRIFERVQSNETFQNFKTRVRDNPVFTGGWNDGNDTTGNRCLAGVKRVSNGLTKCLAPVLSSLLSNIRYIFDCCCGWCFVNTPERPQKNANAKVRAFMPSRGPSTVSTSSSDADGSSIESLQSLYSSSEDEVNVYTKREKIGKKVTFCLHNENERETTVNGKKVENESVVAENQKTNGSSPTNKKQIAPKTDISGRFNPSHPVKIFRESGQGASSSKLRRVLYPSGQASNNGENKATLIQVEENAATEQPQSEGRRFTDEINSSSNSNIHNTVQHDPHSANQSSPPKSWSVLPPASTSQDQKSPLLPPHLSLRISRTPPPVKTPRSSSSSETMGPSILYGNTSSSSDCSSQNSSSEQQHGDSSQKSDLTALERTKEYYRLEKRQMNKLLRVWEARTKPRKMVVDTNSPGRSREWLSHERRRRRQLCLQQEARLNENEDKTEGAPTLPNITLPRPIRQRTLTVGNRLRMPLPIVEKTSQSPTTNTSVKRSSFCSLQQQEQAPSSKDQIIVKEHIQSNGPGMKTDKQRLASESDRSDVSISSISTRSMETTEEGITSVSISLTDSSVSVAQENSKQGGEKPNLDKSTHGQLNTAYQSVEKIPTARPTASNDEGFAMAAEMASDKSASERISNPQLPDKQSNVGATAAENLAWEKLEMTNKHQNKEGIHEYVTSNSKSVCKTSPLSNKNDIPKDIVSSTLQLTDSDHARSTVLDHEAGLSQSMVSCQAGILSPSRRRVNESLAIVSPVRNVAKTTKLASETDQKFTSGSDEQSFERRSKHTTIEIPDCKNFDGQNSMSSRNCSVVKKPKIVRKKSPPFNPFSFWKKDETSDLTPKKRYTHHSSQNNNDARTKQHERVSLKSTKNEKGNKNSVKIGQNGNSTSGEAILGMLSPRRQSKAKFGKRVENKKNDSETIRKTRKNEDSLTQKSSSNFKSSIPVKNCKSSPKSSSGCDAVVPSGFVIENERPRKSVKSLKSSRKDPVTYATKPQASTVTKQPLSTRTSRGDSTNKVERCPNRDRVQDSKKANSLQKLTSAAGKPVSQCIFKDSDTRKTQPIREEPHLQCGRQSSPPHTPTSYIIPPLDFGESSSSNGDNEYLSIPNSPSLTCKPKTDGVNKNSVPLPLSPRYYTLHPNSCKKHPPDRMTRRVTPRTALKSVADEFLDDDDYESFASSDDNDEFWKVEV